MVSQFLRCKLGANSVIHMMTNNAIDNRITIFWKPSIVLPFSNQRAVASRLFSVFQVLCAVDISIFRIFKPKNVQQKLKLCHHYEHERAIKLMSSQHQYRTQPVVQG